MDFRKVKAVLFDLDGTLLDTVKDIGTCVNDVMCRYGLPARPISDYPALVGHGRTDLIQHSVPEGTSEELTKEIERIYADYYRDHCDRFTTLYPGTREFVLRCREEGLVVGMITNKSQPIADRLMAKFFEDGTFSILWGNDGIRPPKPSLASAELACKTLGVKPEEVLFIGDGDTDMEFASKAGFIACGVSWGYRSKEVQQQYGAQLQVDSFKELENLFFV